jgi:hypothetical protein
MKNGVVCQEEIEGMVIFREKALEPLMLMI